MRTACHVGVGVAMSERFETFWLLGGDHRALTLDQALEIEDEIVRRGIAVLAVLGEHCLDDYAQAAGKPGVKVVWGHELDPWVNMLAHHFRGVVAAVGNPACDHVVKGRTKAVDVSPDIDVSL